MGSKYSSSKEISIDGPMVAHVSAINSKGHGGQVNS